MNQKKCWIITEGMAGTENQCIAVAEKLGINYEIKRIGLKFPFNYLCPFVFKTAPQSFITGINWNENTPDLIIASGRKAVAVALHFKHSFKAFIQDPKIKSSYFELVAAPQHDSIKGENVIYTVAAPNKITEDSLSKATAEFDFSYLPNKKIAILIGGHSKSHTMPENFARDLFEHMMPYMKSGDYGFLISLSRRTPDNIRHDIRNLFNDSTCEVWDGHGKNPYHAYLANADFVLVTEDSTSMISDALTSGKPTYRLALNGGSEKFTFLYQNLKRRAGLKIFDGDLRPYEYKPLNDAKLVADEIKKRFEKWAVNR